MEGHAVIVHPKSWCFEPAEKAIRYSAGIRVSGDGDVELYLAEDGRPKIPTTSPTWVQLQLLKSGSLICKDISHRRVPNGGVVKDVIGVYNCEHIAAVLSVRQQDSVLLENILSTLFAIRGHSTTLAINIQVVQDVWREVWFTEEHNGVYSICVYGHDPKPIGFITPAYEGFQVVRDIVLQHYDGWTEASRNMCTSTQHWKSGNAKEADLKDRICFDTDKMCYPCAKRAVDAIWEVQHPGNDAGFDSLKKPTKLTSFVPIPLPPTVDEPLSPWAGGPSTTSGSRRVRADGTVEVFDGKRWKLGYEVPFNILTFFEGAN